MSWNDRASRKSENVTRSLHLFSKPAAPNNASLEARSEQIDEKEFPDLSLKTREDFSC